MDRFKTEISEEISTVGSVAQSEVLPPDREKNEVSEVLESAANDARTETPRVQTEQAQNSQKPNEQASESGKDAATEKKETRGRKPLSDEEKARRKAEREQGKTKTAEPGAGGSQSGSVRDASGDLMSDLSKFKQAQPQQPAQPAQNGPQPGQIDLSKYITGALLLICLDAIMPGVVLYIAGWVDPKYKNVRAAKLKMTAQEKKELEPLADEMVKILFGFVHPAIAFLVATGVIYAGKLFALEDEDFEPKKKPAPLHVVKDGPKKPNKRK